MCNQLTYINYYDFIFLKKRQEFNKVLIKNVCALLFLFYTAIMSLAQSSYVIKELSFAFASICGIRI